jgi:mycothiol synthase
MEKYFARPAQFQDFEAVFSLIQTHFQADYQGEALFLAENLHQIWDACDLETDTLVLVDPSGQIIAHAWFPSCVRKDMVVIEPLFFVLPATRGLGLEAVLIEMVENGRRNVPPASQVVLQPMITNSPMQEALHQAGYSFELAFQKMVMTFEQMPAEKHPPAGLDIRPLHLGHDEQKAYEADEEASLDKGYAHPIPFEAWASRMLNDPELCFLAWDGAEVAGGVYTQIYEGQGLVHHLGVRRPWRNRGVGASLMHQTFAACFRTGLRKVWLEVDTQSPTRAHKLYEKLGMKMVGVRSYYQKVLA